MFITQRRAAVGLTALTAVVGSIALAVPASAIAVPVWPASRMPTGADCPITSYVPYTTSASGQNEYTFTDSQVTKVTNWTVNKQATQLVLTPGPTTATFRILTSQTCGGTLAVKSGLLINGVRLSDNFAFAQETLDPFTASWVTSTTVSPALVGIYRIPTVNVLQRYSSFVLKDDWSMVSSTPSPGPITTVTGPWSTKAFYVLRATTLSNSLSAAKVKKGKTVKATAQLKMAGTSAYVADPGVKVAVQTKVGKGKWVTNATLTTNSSGFVSYTFVVSATTSVRFVHATTHSGDFSNGVTSAIKVVTRI